ncbi:aminopeptidase N-like [Musca vetustissima]|uniref:aminopeptidase N-like n=1 Tax=Musca vetustissima TaxID=27455 RepID=UPI002AB73DB7|nr:aminopeptidase N-like [Musca vetustissima]
MQSFVGILIVGLAAVLLSAGPAQAGIHGLPPLYRESGNLENPNRRLDARADDLNYRLPNNTLPTHYDVELTTNVHDGTKEFTGTVKIDVTIVEASKTLVLHARQLSIKSAKIESATTGSEELSFQYELEREFLTLSRKTDVNFAEGSQWTVTLEYEGELRTDNGGFYLSTYTDVDGNTRYLATTQFESTDARHAFPCYDEPNKRATFTITINHSPTYNAISNMPVNEAASTPGRTVFQKSVNMPTYIVAFIVSAFEYTEGVLNGIPQRIYSRPESKHEQEWALVSGMLILERLAEYYNVEFMLPKVDQAAIPDFAAGAMENWGLATYREEYMLYNKETSTVATQTNIASIIAHEYCHQWFGNYVAVHWWTYLWLKEGFAALFAYKATDAAYPEWGIWQQFHTDDYQTALNVDAGNSPRPMTHYVQKPLEILSLYDSISYAKSASVLNMWSHALTDKVFQRGLHNYLDTNQYSSAVEDQLFVAIQNAAKEENYAIPAEISAMIGSWSRQGGYPLLTVQRNYTDGSFTVTQKAFYNDEKTQSDKLWYIPFNYASLSKSDFRDTEATNYLLNVPTVEVQAKLAKDEWLILNKQSTGYYRINYDEENWKLITEGLIQNPYKIHPRNRAQLMHDAYRFSASNRLPHAILLEMFKYLPKEDQYAPWSTVNGIITVYNRYLSGDARYWDFQSFVADVVTPIYEKLGINDIPGEHHMQKYTRNVVINMACLAGIQSCLTETNNKLKDLVEKGTAIEPNVQSQIYCNGLKQSGNTVFQYVFNELMESSDQAFRRVLISSLGCSQNEQQLKTFLESSIDKDNKLRTQERITILSPVYSRGSVGLMATIDFLDQHWDEYANLEPGFSGSNPLDDALHGMSSYVVNSEQETKFLALIDKVKTSSYVSSNLETNVKANILANTNWLKSNRDPLMNWFQSYNIKSGSAVISGSTSMAIGTLLFLVISRLF